MANTDSTSSTRRHKFYPSKYIQMIRCDPCSYCGGPSGFADHITPPSQGGSNTWENAAAICISCNSRKSVASVLGYLGWLRVQAEREAVNARSDAWRQLGIPS